MACSKIVELGFILAPTSEWPKSDPKFSLCFRGLAKEEGVEVSLPGPQEIRRELQSHDPGRARDISRSEFFVRLSILVMLGLLHHQFIYT